MLALGGAVTGGFSTPMPDAYRADGGGPGDLSSMPTPPAFTATSTPSNEPAAPLPPMANRGARGPLEGHGSATRPIDATKVVEVSGKGRAGGSAELGATSIRDRAPAPRVLAAPAPEASVGDHGGGTTPTETSVPPAPPATIGGAPSGVFGSGGPVNGLDGAAARDGGNAWNGEAADPGANSPSIANGGGVPVGGDAAVGRDGAPGGDAGNQGADAGIVENGGGTGNAAPGDGGPVRTDRTDRPHGARGADARGGGAIDSPRKARDADNPGNGSSDSRRGRGGEGGRGGGRG